MTGFLSVALPWVLIGIAVTIIAANFGRKKRKLNTKEKADLDEANSPNIDDKENYMSVGMCIKKDKFQFFERAKCRVMSQNLHLN